jgi:MFS superfamily sulfate permease-like transporter
MEVVILALVVIGILLAIVSGVWVAIALVSAISASRAEPDVRRQGNEENANKDRS